MWVSVALMTTLSLAPEPVNQLKLINDRATHGVLGWDRSDQKSPKLYPGDLFVMMFDIEGLSLNPEGRVKYSMGMELKDKNNKVVFSKDPEDQEVTASLGGNRLSASTQTAIGTDTPPGTYTLKVTVTDRDAKKTETLTRTFEVVPAQLGIVRVLVTYDSNAPAPPLAVPGQAFIVNFAPVGFLLDPKTSQPKIGVEMRVLDENGKPVLEKPFTGAATEVTEQFRKLIPMQFILSLNRPGKFKIVLKVNDLLAKKSVEESLDFTVVEPK